MPVQHQYNYLLFVQKISSCSAPKPVFPVIGLIFPTQMYFSQTFIKPCTTFDTDLFPEVAALMHSWCLEPSQQQDFSYWSSHRRANFPRQEQNFLSHFIYSHQYLSSSLQSLKASGLIHLKRCWYLVSCGN